MSFSVSSIIEKSENRDKDLRHMALYDLNTELQKENFKIDESSQRQLAEVVLKLLDDNSSEVQGMAVKCLAPLVQKMSKVQVESSVIKLSNSIINGEDEKRDIAKLALKTVIAKIPVEMAVGPIRKCVEPLLSAVEGDKVETKQDAMEVLADVLSRFGNTLQQVHEPLQNAFVAELGSKRPTVRKRSITCLSALSIHTNDKLFHSLIETVLDGIKKSSAGGEDLRTYIQCASAISKTAGARVGRYLEKFVPLLLKAADKVSEEESEDEVREYIMQAFESFITRCPEEVKNHVDFILILCKEYLEYDPNYDYDDSDSDDEEKEEEADEEMEDAMEGGDEEEEEEEEEDSGDITDDDDISWKVRTASIKCIGALIKTRPDMATTLFKELCSKEEHPLISRFKERTESVKLEIFTVFTDLLSLATSTTTTSTGDQVVTQHKEIKYVKEIKSLIMKHLKMQLAIKSSKVKLGVFTVLKKLVITLQGGLEEYVTMVVNAAKSALASRDDQNVTLKLEVLVFLRLMLKYHDPKLFTKHIDTLTKSVYDRVHEKYYKIIAESLRVCGELVQVIGTLKGDRAAYDRHAKSIFDNVFDRLQIQDIDQDVKESAINTMGLIIARLGDSSGPDLKRALPVLVERLDNEITRLTTCKTLGTIARAKIDISPVLGQVVKELALYLRKYNRPLRQASLTTLRDLVQSYPTQIKDYELILTESERLLVDSDLFLAHLTLQLAAQILQSNSIKVADVQKIIMARLLDLLESTTLQGAALESLLTVLRALVQSIGFTSLLNAVLDRAQRTETAQKQVFTNIGKSVAALCEIASPAEKQSTIERFTKDLKNESDQKKLLALYALGEIGRTIDLSGVTEVRTYIDTFFDKGSEEIKNATSYALGNISVGNLGSFVPHIINEIRTKESRKYLLVHSLKEIISQADATAMKPFVQDTVQLLLENAGNDEEGVRNVVSECLGKLALVDYAAVMPQLRLLLKDPAATKRAAVISACKFTITDQPRPQIDEKLRSDVLEFLVLLNKQEDVSVRRAAVLLLTSIAHNKPLLLINSLDKFLPHLYAECAFDEALVRVIKLGPFNHRIDDGLELRKSSFECLDTILDSYKGRIDAAKFVSHLHLGLSDENPDINLLTDLIVIKAAQLFPDEVMKQADELVKPIANTLKKKLKENALEQERERHEELVQSTMRAVYAMSKIKGSEDNPAFYDLLKRVVEQDSVLKNVLRTVAESDEHLTGSTVLF